MNHKTFLPLALLLNLYGCSKEPVPQLPPATHTGANILACKVNGQVYIATISENTAFLGHFQGVSWVIYYGNTAFIYASGNSSLDNNMGTPDFSLGLSSYYYGIGTYSIIPTTWSPEGGYMTKIIPHLTL